MQKRKGKLAVAIPVSVVSDIPHLREKTLEVGLIGRAMALFRVDEIIVFSDKMAAYNQKKDRTLIVTLLSYMETPQYLRKRLFKIKPELRYAGILPPLRTPHHPIEKRARKLKKGEYREGVIVAVNEQGSLVDIGVEHPFLIREQKLSIIFRLSNFLPLKNSTNFCNTVYYICHFSSKLPSKHIQIKFGVFYNIV